MLTRNPVQEGRWNWWAPAKLPKMKFDLTKQSSQLLDQAGLAAFGKGVQLISGPS